MPHFRTVALMLTAVLAAAPAAAAIKLAIYTGVVTSGYDKTGVFGHVAPDLTGTPFIAEFKYDTTVGDTADHYGDNLVEERFGGLTYGAHHPTPIIDSFVELNGVAVHVDGSFMGRIIGYSVGIQHDSAMTDDDPAHTVTDSLQFFANAPYARPSLDANTAAAGISNDHADFFFFTRNAAGIYTSNADAHGAITSIVVTSGVAEPATWATMVAGFAAAGLAARRRRMRAVA